MILTMNYNEIKLRNLWVIITGFSKTSQNQVKTAKCYLSLLFFSFLKFLINIVAYSIKYRHLRINKSLDWVTGVLKRPLITSSIIKKDLPYASVAVCRLYIFNNKRDPNFCCLKKHLKLEWRKDYNWLSLTAEHYMRPFAVCYNSAWVS